MSLTCDDTPRLEVERREGEGGLAMRMDLIQEEMARRMDLIQEEMARRMDLIEEQMARRMDLLQEEMARLRLENGELREENGELRVENREFKHMMKDTIKHELTVACMQDWNYDPEEERFCVCRQVGIVVGSSVWCVVGSSV